MRTNEIPEEEKSKLRFIRELPFILQVPIDRIIQNASSWDKALENIDITLTKLITSIDAIKSVRAKFKLLGPVGEQRKEKRG